MEEFRRTTVRAVGINFHALESGDGPLALCLHGFPDTPRSFRHQMPVLAAAGFRAVAPFMRGYAPTEAPADGRYDTAALAEDTLGLITALGYQEAVVLGHDWGAVAAYFAALAAPKLVRKMVTFAVPYGAQLFGAMISNFAQQKRSWYMFFFQQPLAEVALRDNDFALLEGLWRDWSPGWRWAPEDMNALKECFRAPGTVEAALGYYRATMGPVLRQPAMVNAMGQAMAPIQVPAMMIHGRDDGCIGVEVLAGMEASFPCGLRVELIDGAGHFVHQEKPEPVNRLITDFLKS